MLNEYRQEERGLEAEEEKFDTEAFNKQVKAQLALMAEKDPEKAEEARKFIFERNELDEAWDRVVPKEEIMYYPGSAKGPEPEDDPEFYAKWLVEHQPPSAFPDGVVNLADLAVKQKFLKPKTDAITTGIGVGNSVYQRYTDYFFNTDELHPVKDNFDIRPEFALFKKSNFTTKEDVRPPEIVFTSVQGPNELPPIMPDAPYAYHHLHEPLERWTIFRQLPELLKFDKDLYDFMGNVKKGMAVMPDFKE